MKRHKGLVSISHDHFHGLMLAQLIKKNAPEYKDLPNDTTGKVAYAIKFYNEELIPHFYLEENVLYPAVKGRNKEVDNLFEEMKKEHKQITSLVNKLKEEGDFEDKLDKLGNVLADHIRKEERVIFQKVQALLSDEELIQLNKELRPIIKT